MTDIKAVAMPAISLEQSIQFARLSGDFNPLHIDPLHARRLQFGKTVTHGVHVILAALDAALADDVSPISLTSVSANFDRPVMTGVASQLRISVGADQKVQLAVLLDSGPAQSVDFGFIDRAPSPDAAPTATVRNLGAAAPCAPKERWIDGVEDLSETLPLHWDEQLGTALFPNLLARLPVEQLIFLMATTQVVGMASPGLHSVFTRLDVSFAPGGALSSNTFDYRVVATDQRFNRLQLAIEHTLGQAAIEAFFRPRPVRQASFSDIAALGSLPDLSGRRALVIGGSRGLGEVTAKLFAASGGDVLIGYASGADDAARVCAEMSNSGTAIQILKTDVLDASSPWFDELPEGQITDVFYFASPVIEKSREFLWDQGLFAHLSRFYLQGLANVLTPFLRDKERRKLGARVIVPSTVFIDEPPDGFAEYVAAKGAAEAFARQVTRKYRRWTIDCPRLPRLLTDQTSGVVDQSPLSVASELSQLLLRPQSASTDGG